MELDVNQGQMFVTSPRNSVAAHTNLFQRLDCTTLVAPVLRPPPTTAILESQSLDVIDVPSVYELITQQYAQFELSKTPRRPLKRLWL